MLTVKKTIEILKTMPQEAQLMVCDCNCLSSARSIHTEDLPSKNRDVHLTVVVVVVES